MTSNLAASWLRQARWCDFYLDLRVLGALLLEGSDVLAGKAEPVGQSGPILLLTQPGYLAELCITGNLHGDRRFFFSFAIYHLRAEFLWGNTCIPTDTWHNNNIIIVSKRRTSWWRYYVVCPLDIHSRFISVVLDTDTSHAIKTHFQARQKQPDFTQSWFVLLTRGPFNSHGLTLIPSWIIDYVHCKVWGEITYPFPNFNGAVVWKLMGNFIPCFTGHIVTCWCWN